MKVLKTDIENLSIKVRFIRDFIAGKIKIASKKKAEIEAQLSALKYPVSAKEGDYMYLLRMPMYNLTKRRLKSLLRKDEGYGYEYTELAETNGSSMWREELNQFAPIKVKIMKKK